MGGNVPVGKRRFVAFLAFGASRSHEQTFPGVLAAAKGYSGLLEHGLVAQGREQRWIAH